jgi:hypothetical protein
MQVLGEKAVTAHLVALADAGAGVALMTATARPMTTSAESK